MEHQTCVRICPVFQTLRCCVIAWQSHPWYKHDHGGGESSPRPKREKPNYERRRESNMMSELKHLPQVVQNNISAYASGLRETGGDAVRSLILFGRVLDASFDVEHQAIRNIVVLDRVDLDLLRRIGQAGTRWGGLGMTAPLVMTPDYIKSSLDTFPLELLDIQMRHKTVFGDDPFDALSFEEGHVRLQCERDLKTVLIGMRQGLLATGGDDRRLGSVETDVGEGMLRTLRGLLWLRGKKERCATPALLDEVSRSFECDLPGIRKALDPNEHHDYEAFQQLYRDVEALGALVDAW